MFRAAQELESELAATKSVKVAKAVKTEVQGVDAQAKSALVGVIVEDSGTSGKKKKKKGGGSMNFRGQARGASGASESNNNNSGGISVGHGWHGCCQGNSRGNVGRG